MNRNDDINREFDAAVDQLCKGLGIKRKKMVSLDRARLYLNVGFLNLDQIMVALTDEATMGLGFEESLKLRGWLPGEGATPPGTAPGAAPNAGSGGVSSVPGFFVGTGPGTTTGGGGGVTGGAGGEVPGRGPLGAPFGLMGQYMDSMLDAEVLNQLRPLMSQNNLPLTISLTIERLREKGLKESWDALMSLEMQVLDPLSTGRASPATRAKIEHCYKQILKKYGEQATSEMLIRQLERQLKTLMLDPDALAHDGKEDPPIDQEYYEFHRGLFKLPEINSEHLANLVKSTTENCSPDEAVALNVLSDFVGSMEQRSKERLALFQEAATELEKRGLDKSWDIVVKAVCYMCDPLGFDESRKETVVVVSNRLAIIREEFGIKPVREQLVKRLKAAVEVSKSRELVPQAPDFQCDPKLEAALLELFALGKKASSGQE